jgi:hypothetical protein
LALSSLIVLDAQTMIESDNERAKENVVYAKQQQDS